MYKLRYAIEILLVIGILAGTSVIAQAQNDGRHVASIEGYAVDYTDGSIGGWNSVYPYLSFDDEYGRRGKPNGVWKGSYYVNDNKLTLIIDDLEAPHPPIHTLGVGYTVTLRDATFEDGTTTKDIIILTYSGRPTQRHVEKTVAIVRAEQGVSSSRLKGSSTPGFGAMFTIIGLLLVCLINRISRVK